MAKMRGMVQVLSAACFPACACLLEDVCGGAELVMGCAALAPMNGWRTDTVPASSSRGIEWSEWLSAAPSSLTVGSSAAHGQESQALTEDV